MDSMSEETTPRYKVNDTVTVSRGKERGETGTVLHVDAEHKKYAVQLTSGLKVVAFSAVKPKTEPSLSAALFAEVANRYAGQLPDGFLADLENAAPGLTENVAIAVA